jgi:hypothetical protein
MTDTFVIDARRCMPGRVIGSAFEQPRLMHRIETPDEIIEKVRLVFVVVLLSVL